MNSKIIELREKLATLHQEIESVLDEAESASDQPIPGYSLRDPSELCTDMKQRKQGLSFEDSELQTGISRSTIKRMFKDPMKTSLENFLTIANELGMKIWVEK